MTLLTLYLTLGSMIALVSWHRIEGRRDRPTHPLVMALIVAWMILLWPLWLGMVAWRRWIGVKSSCLS